MKEFLCKDVFGQDTHWDPSKLNFKGICRTCKFTRGKCSNKYITGKNIGPILYCEWYELKK